MFFYSEKKKFLLGKYIITLQNSQVK